VSRPLEVGVSVHDSLMQADPERRRELLDGVEAAGLDHVTLGDHISFHGGSGFDGLIAATAVLATHDRLRVLLAVYQLALRHPLAVARQLASLSQVAPGRVTLGVGVGGEDRSEISNCGVDPASRGRRLDESLVVLRQLASGEAVDHDGEFFRLDSAAILPPPVPAVPLVIGGSGEPAVQRAAAVGDGWVGIFCTARRFAETRTRILDEAARLGRSVDWFGVSVWCGLDDNAVTARDRLGREMQALYQLPSEKFAHLTAAGPPQQVAEYLAPYVEGGANVVSIVPVAGNAAQGVAMAGEVRRLLAPLIIRSDLL
jgi:alkanesulfonate monooxygenase SsuD/methylene tetrahydromethanopterin reductase-like flavin-dependent oxidoreductase (luciferase family)